MAVATARAARSGYNLATVSARFNQMQGVQGADPSRDVPQEAPQGGAPSYPTALGESFRVHNFQGQTAGSNTDVAFNAIEQINAVHSFRANVAMLQADDERFGSLLDIKV
jgi:hypothetical protein